MKKSMMLFQSASLIKTKSKRWLISALMRETTQKQKNKLLKLVLERVTKAMLERLYILTMKNKLPRLKLTTRKKNLRLTSRKAYTKLKTKRRKTKRTGRKRKVGTRFRSKNGRMMKVVKGGRVQFV